MAEIGAIKSQNAVVIDGYKNC